MPSRFEAYRMKDGVTRLGEAFFNEIFRDIDLRLSRIEEQRNSLDLYVDDFAKLGLQRIDEVLRDAFLTISLDIEGLQSAEKELSKLLEKTKLDLINAVGSVAPILSIDYADRSALRTLTGSSGRAVSVAGLGLFFFVAGSTEPDDDESCFATTGGCWLLECPSWDLIDAWLDHQFDADRPIFASVNCGISSISANSSVKFSAHIPGARTGDVVFATPPSELGQTTSDSQKLSFVAYVSAPDTVSISLSNTKDTSALIKESARGVWAIAVLKER